MLQASDLMLPDAESVVHEESFQEAKNKMIERFEKSYIRELLLAHHGNITKAAQAAQKNRRAFWQLIRKHQVDMRCFRTADSTGSRA
jgi:DNA-binding NtrC family response regulator